MLSGNNKIATEILTWETTAHALGRAPLFTCIPSRGLPWGVSLPASQLDTLLRTTVLKYIFSAFLKIVFMFSEYQA